MSDMKSRRGENLEGLHSEHTDLHKIIVTNLNKTVTDQNLKDFFNEYTDGVTEGHFLDVKIMDKEGRDTNFAFITFDRTTVTDSAIAAMYRKQDRDRQLHKNTVNVKRAVPRQLMLTSSENHSAITRQLFVANLPWSGLDVPAELKRIIGGAVGDDCPLGKIGEYQVLMWKDPATGKPTGQYRGIAYIHLESRDDVEQKDKDKLPDHLADKLAIQFGYRFRVGNRDSVELKKNIVDGGGMNGHLGGPRGGFQASGFRGGRGGFRGGGGGFRGRRGGFETGYFPPLARGGFLPRGRGMRGGAMRGGAPHERGPMRGASYCGPHGGMRGAPPASAVGGYQQGAYGEVQNIDAEYKSPWSQEAKVWGQQSQQQSRGQQDQQQSWGKQGQQQSRGQQGRQQSQGQQDQQANSWSRQENQVAAAAASWGKEQSAGGYGEAYTYGQGYGQ